MIFIFIFLFFSFSFSKIIDHQIPNNAYLNSPLEIKVYTDYTPDEIIDFKLFYKSGNSEIFLQSDLNLLTSDFYSFTIPSDFLNEKYIDYYILLENTNGNFISIPSIDPYDVPISILIEEEIEEELLEENFIDYDVNIISPQPEQKIEKEDLFIALSYFRMKDLDFSLTKIFVDDIDLSNSADIRETNLTLSESSLSTGNHQVKVLLYNLNGESYQPIIWDFYILGDLEGSSSSYDGKFWNDYLINRVDSLKSYTNNSNLDFSFNNDWIGIKTKLKKSSLENPLYQARDRYLFDIELSDNIKLKYGDFYPSQSDFTIRGNRVRGIGFNYKSSKFEIDLVSGELARSIQGNPYQDAVIISDYSSEYICDEYDGDNCVSGYDNDYVDISRLGYTFKRNISALRIGIGKPNGFNYGFSILKAKDDINSVNKDLDGAVISLPTDLDVFNDFNSDIFIDLNSDGLFTDGEPIYEDNSTQFQIDGSWDYDDEGDIPSNFLTDTYSANLITSKSSLYVEDCQNLIDDYGLVDISLCENETYYDLVQYVWDIKVSTENIQSYLNTNYDLDFEQGQINILENQWDGDKPEDNIIFGSDLNFSTKNKRLKIKSSVAMSFINGNIWNPVKTVDEFDTYSDDYTDCEFGTTYSNVELLTEDCTDSYQSGGCNPSDHYWHECKAYVYLNGAYDSDLEIWNLNDDIEIQLEILEQGIALDAIPDPESFEDIFHYNFDAVPTIPFYKLIQKIENGESLSFIDIFDSPEIAYNVDFSLRLLNNQIQFGIKKVGQSFNTLGNPYLQKDIKETYLTDRIRLFQNRMFLTLKYSNILNGISDDSSSDSSEKYDYNLSYYPGIDLPSFTFSFADYKRQSGESELYDLDINNDGLIDNNDILDTRLSTQTNNYNFSVNHNFMYLYNQNLTFTYYYSNKKDLLYLDRGFVIDGNSGESVADTSYISPRSLNKNITINLKTKINQDWESVINFSNNYFDYAQKVSEYFNKQKINSIGGSFNYKMSEKIQKIGSGINYTYADGTSNKYYQFSLQLFSEIVPVENMFINFSYNYKIKSVVSSTDYNNSLFKVNFSYRF